ncbi:PQQ-binding-like beta-propeller repeat protein [Streptomyces sp. NPDC057445]|uniref:outer membrane protein assembly factor BamB family protein n=1 Tax=Streptomyces sp. NPDC057445 TaxID=3346136 RepID=UPI003694615E
MTQPPQPPNQPPQQPDQPSQQPQQPQGGFGAPQDPAPGLAGGTPAAGGFGAPTPPPQNPGYGYPQTPPGGPDGYGYPQQTPPPGQPHGYGYPQTPPGQPAGYGYPQQTPPPGQPHGYGYPGGPGQPQYAPPLPPRPKKISTQMQIIIAAVVAVVLIVGTGVWYATTDGDSGKERARGSQQQTGDENKPGGGSEKVPSSTKSRKLVNVPQPKVDDLAVVEGSWLTDTVYAKSDVLKVVGYDSATGGVKWTIPTPGQICGATRHVSGDRTAVLFEPAKRKNKNDHQACSEVGVIDLAAGKMVWTGSAKGANSGDQKVRFQEVTLSGTTVAAGGLDGGAAWSLADGKSLWTPTADAQSCYDLGYGGGELLAAVRKCGGFDAQYIVIQNLNPATGAPLSTFKMPAGVEYASIVSTKPLVVAADVGDTAGDGSGISDFFVVEEKTGKLKVKIAADADRYAAECRSTEVESCNMAVVGNGRLYLPTEEHEGTGEYGDTNEIVSFDLTTGKPTTDKADAGDRYTLFPLRMDGSNILAYKTPPYDKGGQIVSIDSRTMKQTVLMENPGTEDIRDAETSFSADSAEIRYGNGRLFLSETLISKPYKEDDSRKEYLIVSFATG